MHATACEGAVCRVAPAGSNAVPGGRSRRAALDSRRPTAYAARLSGQRTLRRVLDCVHKATPMKIRNSLKSAKTRDKNCRVVRRHGRVYVINKKNPRMKARQG